MFINLKNVIRRLQKQVDLEWGINASKINFIHARD